MRRDIISQPPQISEQYSWWCAGFCLPIHWKFSLICTLQVECCVSLHPLAGAEHNVRIFWLAAASGWCGWSATGSFFAACSRLRLMSAARMFSATFSRAQLYCWVSATLCSNEQFMLTTGPTDLVEFVTGREQRKQRVMWLKEWQHKESPLLWGIVVAVAASIIRLPITAACCLIEGLLTHCVLLDKVPPVQKANEQGPQYTN